MAESGAHPPPPALTEQAPLSGQPRHKPTPCGPESQNTVALPGAKEPWAPAETPPASVTWLTAVPPGRGGLSPGPPEGGLGQAGPRGSRWVSGRQDTWTHREEPGEWCAGSRERGATEHSGEPGGRLPCPHLESCFQGQPPHPQRQSTVKGAEKGSDMIKGTWGGRQDFPDGGRRGERERERLRRGLGHSRGGLRPAGPPRGPGLAVQEDGPGCHWGHPRHMFPTLPEASRATSAASQVTSTGRLPAPPVPTKLRPQPFLGSHHCSLGCVGKVLARIPLWGAWGWRGRGSSQL